jgi:hypothetical protein
LLTRAPSPKSQASIRKHLIEIGLAKPGTSPQPAVPFPAA